MYLIHIFDISSFLYHTMNKLGLQNLYINSCTINLMILQLLLYLTRYGTRRCPRVSVMVPDVALLSIMVLGVAWLFVMILGVARVSVMEFFVALLSIMVLGAARLFVMVLGAARLLPYSVPTRRPGVGLGPETGMY